MPAPKRRPPGGTPRRPAALARLDPRWTSPFPADPRWFLAILLAAGLAVRLAALALGLQAASPPQVLLPRLVSVLAGAAALVVAYHLGRRLLGIRLGLAVAAVVALAPAAWEAEARTASAGLLTLAALAATLSLLETGRRGRPPGGWTALAAVCGLLGLAWLGLGPASLRPDPGAWLRFLAAPAWLSGAVLPLSWKGAGPPGPSGLEPAAAVSMSLGFWLLATLGWLRLGWRNRREATLLALVFLVPLLAAAAVSSLGWRALQPTDLAPVLAPFLMLVLLGMPTTRLGLASAGLLVLVNLANAAFLLHGSP